MISPSLIAPIQCLPSFGTVISVSSVAGARKECSELICQKKPGFSLSLVLCYFRRSGGSVRMRVLRCDVGRLVAFMSARMLGVCARACMLSLCFFVCLSRSVCPLSSLLLLCAPCLSPSLPSSCLFFVDLLCVRSFVMTILCALILGPFLFSFILSLVFRLCLCYLYVSYT